MYGEQITEISAYKERPELSKCLDNLSVGDNLVVHKLNRLERSMVEMLEHTALIERGVAIKTLNTPSDRTSEH
ncbi:recombinase family protein [Synechococcus sp. RS9902]|uniref:recombinase family protein n=1 Tax=Synechococcus sp. RS9902 TaxID=221345 RepID=UPI001645DDB8